MQCQARASCLEFLVGEEGLEPGQIKRVIDTLHFAPSSSSRLLQAADLVAFLARRIFTHTETDPRAKQPYTAMWDRVTPKVSHEGCWWPEPK